MVSLSHSLSHILILYLSMRVDDVSLFSFYTTAVVAVVVVVRCMAYLYGFLYLYGSCCSRLCNAL